MKDRERQTERGRETRLTYGQGVMAETRTFHLHVLSVSSFKGATSNQKKPYIYVSQSLGLALTSSLYADRLQWSVSDLKEEGEDAKH